MDALHVIAPTQGTIPQTTRSGKNREARAMKIELDFEEVVMAAIMVIVVAALLASANLTGCYKDTEKPKAEQK